MAQIIQYSTIYMCSLNTTYRPSCIGYTCSENGYWSRALSSVIYNEAAPRIMRMQGCIYSAEIAHRQYTFCQRHN